MCCSGLHAAGRKWWQRVCQKQRTEPNVLSNVPVPVVLHVYNFHGVSSTVNQLIQHTVGGQVLHAGVEVYGQEWSYGETDKGTGLMRCKPKQAELAGHNFCESVYMGETTLSKQDVKELLRDFAREWRGSDYDVLRHNCCHFCDRFCQRLGVGHIPQYVNCLADKVASIDDVLKEADSTMEANFEKARAKTAEINTLICDTFKAKTDELIDNIKVAANPESNQTNLNIQEFFEVKTREFKNSFEAASRDFQSHADELQRKINGDFRSTLEATSREFRSHADEFDRKLRSDFMSKIEAASRDIREKTDELDRKLRQDFVNQFDDFQAQADELDRQFKMCHNANEAVSTEELVLR